MNKHRINILVILTVSLLALTWFNGYDFISVGDFAFSLSGKQFLNNTIYFWDPDIGTGYSAPRQMAFIMPYSLLSGLFELIGMNQQILERVLFYFWFSLSGISAYYLCSYVIRKSDKVGSFCALSGGLFYMMNFYSMSVIWHLASGLLVPAYSAFPLILLFFIKTSDKSFRLKNICLFLLVWFFLGSYMYANPALLAVHILPLIVYVLFSINRGNVRRTCFAIVSLSLVFVCLNAFWILPVAMDFLNTYKGSVHNGLTGFISDKDTFLLNSAKLIKLLGLRGEWDILGEYRNTPYHSWGKTYSLPFFVLLGYIITLISISSLLKKGVFRIYLYLALLFLVGLFVVKGPNGPLGSFTLWFYENIPFIMTAFRANIQKFGMVIILALTPLFSAGLFFLYKYCERKLSKAYLQIGVVVFFVLFFGINVYPFWTHEVIFHGSKEFPGAQFTVPDYYRRLNLWSKGINRKDRILSLPITKNSNAAYFWKYNTGEKYNGYTGGDFIRWFVDRPVIYTAKTPIERFLVSSIEENGRSYKNLNYYNLLSKENVRYVMVHNDWYWDFFRDHPWQFKFTGHKISDFLRVLNLSKPAWKFGKLDVYKISDDNYLPKIYQTGVFPLLILGEWKAFTVMKYASYFNGQFAFIDQQDGDSLQSLVGSRQSAINKQILFANSGFNDLVIDLVKTEAQSSEED